MTSVDGGRGDWSMLSAPCPKVASLPLLWFRAAMTYVKKRVDSLSLASSESQESLVTTWLSRVASNRNLRTHSLTSVVFQDQCRDPFSSSIWPDIFTRFT